jgi:progesterone-induced-blocking factor 1
MLRAQVRERRTAHREAAGDSAVAVQRLKEELDEKNKLLESLQGTHERQLRELTETVARLDHRKRVLELQLQSGIQNYEAEVRRKQAQTQAELTLLRRRVEELESEGPGVHGQLALIKDSLRDLAVSESLYLEFKRIPEERQSVKEFVCVRVFELLQQEKAARAALGAEADALRERLVVSEGEAGRLRRELDAVTKARKAAEQELLDDSKRLESVNERLSGELAAAQGRVQELEGKGALFDKVSARVAELESQNEELSKQVTLQAVALRATAADREELQKRLSDAEQSLEMLRLDKMYLSKEVQAITDRCTNAERDKERLIEKNRELKKSREEMVEKLVRVREENKSHYEERLSAELHRLQERTAHDLESIRVTQKEAYEREIQGLRDSRDLAVAEQQRLAAKYESQRTAYEQLLEEHRALQSRMDTTVQELRSQLKLKSFELDRMGLTFEETMAEVRRLKLEIDMHVQKNQVLASECVALRTEATRRESEQAKPPPHVAEALRDKEEQLRVARSTIDHLHREVDRLLAENRAALHAQQLLQRDLEALLKSEPTISSLRRSAVSLLRAASISSSAAGAATTTAPPAAAAAAAKDEAGELPEPGPSAIDARLRTVQPAWFKKLTARASAASAAAATGQGSSSGVPRAV